MNTLKLAMTALALLTAGPARAGLGPHAHQAQQQQQEAQRVAPKPVVRQETIKPVESLQLKEVTKGVTRAELWGAPKALHGSLTKFAAGTKIGMHTHSRNLSLVVVSGTIIHGDEAGVETKLAPGSYLAIPGGVRHTTACAAGSDCLFYEEVVGEFDLKMEDHP